MRATLVPLLGFCLLGCATVGGRDKGARWVRVEASEDQAGRRFALVVGVEQFEDSRFTPLRFAERDASAVAASLEGFERVVQLTGDQTRRPTVLAALEELLREAHAPGDTVLVYVSSHGSLAQRPGGALERVIVTRDARMDVLLETGIPVEELAQRLERAPAKRRLMILALCHSGKGKSQLSDGLARAIAAQKAPLNLEARSEATIVLTACAFGETARESDALGHDVYTFFFLEGLQKGDLDGDGAVTASEVHDYARTRTYAFTDGSQRPTSESEVLGIDPIVLRGRRTATGRPVVFSYARSAEGLGLRVDGQDKGALPGTVALEPGTHLIALVDSSRKQTVYSGEVSLEAGERRDVASLLPEPPHLEVALGGGARAPLGGPLRTSVPLAGGVRLRVGSANLARPGVMLEGTLGYFQGSDTEAGIDATLSRVVRQVAQDFGIGYRVRPGGSLAIDALAVAGASWIRRERSAPGFSGIDGTLAALLGLRLRGVLRPGSWPVSLALSVEAAITWPRIEDETPTAGTLQGLVEVGWPGRP